MPPHTNQWRMILIQRGLSKRGTSHSVDLAYGESHAVITLSKGNLILRKLGVLHMEFRPMHDI
jgi:hypothetical protein